MTVRLCLLVSREKEMWIITVGFLREYFGSLVSNKVIKVRKV